VLQLSFSFSGARASFSQRHNIILLVYRERLRHLFYKRQGEKWMSKVFSSFCASFMSKQSLFFSSLTDGE
jgi:hypothetical protein